MKLIDITGKKFHKLLVIEYAGRNRTSAQWLCLCDCGNKVIVVGNKLRSGHTKSCKCNQKEAVKKMAETHGMTNSPEYGSWRSMRERCNNPNNIGYKDYGAKGITVCERWQSSFENFLKDMGKKPTTKHTVDRKDFTKGYSPENCKWATYLEQGSNIRRNVYIEYNGERLIIAHWARKFGINPSTISIANKENRVIQLFDKYVNNS